MVVEKETTRWCYGCDEIKPLDHEHWAWADKEHTRFRTKCRKCTNWDSKISHRIHRKGKKANASITNKEKMV